MTEKNGPPDPTTESYSMMSADVYDAIYARKNYEAEAQALKDVIGHYTKTDGNQLLDVACGTGRHLSYLVDTFSITGVDLSNDQLVAARKRLPDVAFIQGDMQNFELDRKFDAVTCLFSSIGYVYPYKNMERAVMNMAHHLKPGGVLIIEPWLQPDVFDPRRPPHTDVSELPEMQLKVTRTGHNNIDGNVSILTMHHVVESPEGVAEFTEEHRLAMHSTEEYRQAYESAGLTFTEDPQGLSGRGIYIGVKPL